MEAAFPVVKPVFITTGRRIILPRKRWNFLKHEYGTGGHSHACSGATHSGQDHDAKGVAYTKSGCDKLQMSWAQVVQRIDGLIRKGRYLSPEEEAERQAIEEAKTDPLEDVYDRFAVIDTEDGEYAIWDNQTDDYYVDRKALRNTSRTNGLPMTIWRKFVSP